MGSSVYYSKKGGVSGVPAMLLLETGVLRVIGFDRYSLTTRKRGQTTSQYSLPALPPVGPLTNPSSLSSTRTRPSLSIPELLITAADMMGCVSPKCSVPKGIPTPPIGLGFLGTRSTKAHLGIGMELTDRGFTSPAFKRCGPVLTNLTICGLTHTDGYERDTKQPSCCSDGIPLPVQGDKERCEYAKPLHRAAKQRRPLHDPKGRVSLAYKHVS